jgi:prevent-host-death family protein
MPIATFSSREFNQDTSRAKKAAKQGPVVITDRGRPSFVLLNIDEYNKLSGSDRTISDMLSMPKETPAFDFDFEELRSITPPREFDLE